MAEISAESAAALLRVFDNQELVELIVETAKVFEQKSELLHQMLRLRFLIREEPSSNQIISLYMEHWDRANAYYAVHHDICHFVLPFHEGQPLAVMDRTTGSKGVAISLNASAILDVIVKNVVDLFKRDAEINQRRAEDILRLFT